MITSRRRIKTFVILAAYQEAFERFGHFLASKPLAVLLVSIFIIIGCCLGFFRLNVEQPSIELFTVTHSQSRRDSHNSAQFFPILEARQEQIIMTAKHGESILSEKCLKDVVMVHRAIENISGYADICFRQQLPSVALKGNKKSCVISSPLELAGTHFQNLKNLSLILARELVKPTTVLSSGQTFNSSYPQMLANFHIDRNRGPLTARADALRVIYFIRKTTSTKDYQEIEKFEASFGNLLISISPRMKCAELSYKTERATTDALQDVLKPETWPLYVSVFTMVVLAFIVLHFSSTNSGCLRTIFLIFFSIVFPLTCSAGVISMINFAFSPTSLFIPFLVLGKATTDVILFLVEWERQKKVRSLEHRVVNCLAKTGILATVTALCGSLLCGMAVKSSFEGISHFFFAALVTYLVFSASTLTITVTVLLYFERKLNTTNTSCETACERLSITEVESVPLRLSQCHKTKVQQILKELARKITSTGGKMFSLGIFALLITLCVCSAFRTRERTRTIESHSQNENFKKFSKARQMFLGNETDVSIVFSEDINYSLESVQNQVISLCKKLQEATYSEGTSLCWMADFRQWVKHQNMSCLYSRFYRCLELFLNSSYSIPTSQDLLLEDSSSLAKISASRIHLRMILKNRFSEDRESLRNLRVDLQEQSYPRAVPVSEEFFDIDDHVELEQETISIVITAGTVVVFAVSLFTTCHLGASTILALTFDLLVLEAAAIMKTTGIHLGPVPFISLYVTIILSLNYSIEVGHSFVLSAKQDIQDRMIDALRSVGLSVLAGTLTSILACVSLGFIFPSLGDIFFLLLSLVFALGSVHALIIFPTFVALFEELVHCFDTKVGEQMTEYFKETNDSILLEARNGDIRKPKAKRPAISIIGISCKFPGANSKELFWVLLEQGKSSIRAFPENRTQEHKAFYQLYNPNRFVNGRLCAIKGSYLEEISTFDNKFFGISNQEARTMDPQQRILLQVVYEAIEDAGMRLEDLQKCRTGVFVGVMNLEYSALVTDRSNLSNVDQYSSTGITASILANRVSFCLNLTGPSIAVDTACSSSLTALKLAYDSLHNDDCDIAIVCAPNVVLNHSMQIVSSMAGLLAPDGRCKSFDASGDGYGRGEGFAAVVLKLSRDALCDKDDVYCDIVACGMNNDGQNAVPITAPSAKMQAKLSRSVLEQSGVAAEDVDYFEAHGTGTAIGDVVEVNSIADTYSNQAANSSRKLRIGSVKSNLNHTESTSGLAGLIKVALMIRNKTFVPTINVKVLNPKLKLDEKGLILQHTREPWKTEKSKPRIAAVNSFGYGGSNVHAILREAASTPRFECENFVRRGIVLTITARSLEALKKMSHIHSEWIKGNAEETDQHLMVNLCYSFNERRSQYPHRLAIAFGTAFEASKSLKAFADASVGWEKLASYAEVTSSVRKVVFMFGGQGSQWYAMGRQLMECETVFREAILKVSRILKDLGEPWSLEVELMAAEDVSRITESYIAQPATFAVQYATAQLLKSWKIHPSAVIGHSLGEFAAACVAGIITVKEAVQLVLTRSTLQDRCPNNGGMAALGMPEVKAKELLLNLRLSTTLDIAAVNDAKSVTVAGESQSIEALGQYLSMNERDVFWRVLGTNRAFHSSHMEPIKKPFQAAMKNVQLNPKLSKIPMYSTVEGEVVSGQQLNSDYWWQNIRCPVRFYSAMKHLLNDGYKQIIEISTQPILAHYVKQIALQEDLTEEERPVVIATLPRKRVPIEDQHKCFLQNTVCKLYTMGFPVDWTSVQGNQSARFIRPPTSPWLESTFWYREHTPQAIVHPIGSKETVKKLTHPYLAQVKMTDQCSGLHCWETEIDLYNFPSLKDHALIEGGAVMPGAAYLEMAFAMVKDKFLHISGLELSDVKLSSLLTLPETQVRPLRLRLLKTDAIDKAQFQITSVQDDQSEIILSSGNISVDLLHTRENLEEEASTQAGLTIDKLIRNMREVPIERFREITQKYGFQYGSAYSIIKQTWHRDHEGLALIDIRESPMVQLESENYVVHPSILDACLQSCFIPIGISATYEKSILPVGFGGITLNDVPKSNQLYCHVVQDVKEFGTFDVTLMCPSGNVVLTMSEFHVAELNSTPRQFTSDDLVYEVQWMKDETEAQRKMVPNLTCLLLRDSSPFSDSLIVKLRAAKVKVITVDPPNALCFDTETKGVIRTAFTDLPSRNSPFKVVNMWPVETTLLPNQFDLIEKAQNLAYSSSVFLIQQLVSKGFLDTRLLLVSESTQLISATSKPDTHTIPWAATIWGLRRTAKHEESDLGITTIDLGNKNDITEVDLLFSEILCDNIEEEVAFREGKRFINRVVRSNISTEQPTPHSNDSDWGSLYLSAIPATRKVCLRQKSFSKPSPSEVTVEMLHCWTPSESVVDVAKPNACVFTVGKVTHLPEETANNQMQIGDVVCGVMASGRVSRSFSIQVSNTFVKPVILTQGQAAYIPACLAIALHALKLIATMKESKKLLIHQAQRGPGPAAVALAKALGHKVFGTISDTCQSVTKSTLLELGAESIRHQSLTRFEDDSRDAFDAVLFFYPPPPNTLQKSSRCLKRGGKVVILGAEFDGDVVFPAKKNVIYVRESFSDILLSPQTYQKLSLESLQLLKGGRLLEKLLEIRLVSTDIQKAVKAGNEFTRNDSPPENSMTASQGISFLIHSFTPSEEGNDLQKIPVLPRGLDECGLKENRTYLVAGGIRGYGFEVARWMAKNGARSIGLIGRSRPSDAEHREVRDIETKTGAKFYMFQIDISSQEQMVSLKEQLKSLPSVAGIVNSAMVLRDEYIKDWTFKSFTDVMAPKIKGSFLLHQLSLEMDLDFFVMFSSMASIVGNMGQSSYSACNAFQDSLAQYRRQVLGLPGLSINWGPISGAGVMERQSNIAKLMTAGGLGFINAKDGVKLMAKVLTKEPSRFQISLFAVDWSRYIKSTTGLQKTPRLSMITTEISLSESQTNTAESLLQRIRLEKDPDKKGELIVEYVRMSVAELTGTSSSSETDLNKSLYSYGIDSTAALTLKMLLESNLQVSFEVFYFMQPDTTTIKMAKDISARLCGKASSPQNSESQGSAPIETQSSEDTSLSVMPSKNEVQVLPLYTPEGSAIKFFCIHPSHRYALNLVPISTGFQGQDLISFYALGFADPTVISEDWGGVRELAAHYVQLITNEQRHGPYFLGGYSYGGLLAYEMASLLTEQNHRVEFVAMIDTFPWSPRSRTINTRLTSMEKDGWLPSRHVQLQFESYLEKLAVDSLKMNVDEYREMKERHSQDWIIDELQKRSLTRGLTTYNLRTLKEALLRNQTLANRTHQEWQPAEVRYRGPLTFLKCQDRRFFSRNPTSHGIEEVWSQLVDGGTTVLVCPGDHYSLSELPHAQVTGGILAIALAFTYRMLFPEFPTPPRTFNQRRAVGKLSGGVGVFLHSKRGNKMPHYGGLFFREDIHRLELRSKPGDEEAIENEKTKKIIDLKELRMVQPGRLVSSALKYTWRKRRVGGYESGNLGHIASVATSRRVYNLEFCDYSDLEAFYDMVEAVFAVKLLTI
ncbi:uncharacterized protein LOC111325863 [Stylophora pistillata]|uniref:Phthiocerol synthesis polyketide synthase type I PpsC n=1 Tax=Stylophora pistillata TaxID=50429 RepID=A0A2B4SJY3_STYPI|nr:uncharacterized protein LOC111325863 [Stylophora pistillata]PFX28735.1 Phthiocerol synthesis polyketide synthase type I PpsC [Stylophora pistillata]